MNFGIHTPEDLEKFVSEQPPEGVQLEYKNSRILQKSDTQAICKAISAFANSAGGVFVIGIDASTEQLILDGGWSGASRLDWLHRVINSGTFPAVETAYVTEIVADSGRYYVIDVKVSPKAPHQSQDQRYYRRRGSHSDPMEHYEIEDIRSRPASEQLPIEVSLFTERQLVSFKLRNTSHFEPVENLTVTIQANFDFERDTTARLQTRGLRQLRAGVEHVFLIDSFFTILQANPEPEFTITVSYDWRGRREHDSATFFIGDYLNTSIINPPVVEALSSLEKKIESIKGSIDKLANHAESWKHITDGSGLRLSHRTIKALLQQEQRFDPTEFDWKGYQLILDSSDDDAIKLHHIFNTFGGYRSAREEYDELSVELKAKFERIFQVKFNDG